MVIPCYNEERNLRRGVLAEVETYLRCQPLSWEVIVVNDESTDNSKALVEHFIETTSGFELVDIPHGGKPQAVWAGIQRSRGNIILFTDMDQSTPIEELGKLLPWYRQGFDIVIGSRGGSRSGFPLLRKVGSAAFARIRRTIFLPKINDTQCGFKTCRREPALQIFPRLEAIRQTARPKGWKVSAYDVELLFLFEKSGFRVKEVEVFWRNCDESDSKNREGGTRQYLGESVDMLREVLRVRINQMRGYYS